MQRLLLASASLEAGDDGASVDLLLAWAGIASARAITKGASFIHMARNLGMFVASSHRGEMAA